MEFYIYLSVNVNWTFYVQTFIILSLDCKINRRRRLFMEWRKRWIPKRKKQTELLTPRKNAKTQVILTQFQLFNKNIYIIINNAFKCQTKLLLLNISRFLYKHKKLSDKLLSSDDYLLFKQHSLLCIIFIIITDKLAVVQTNRDKIVRVYLK